MPSKCPFPDYSSFSNVFVSNLILFIHVLIVTQLSFSLSTVGTNFTVNITCTCIMFLTILARHVGAKLGHVGAKLADVAAGVVAGSPCEQQDA